MLVPYLPPDRQALLNQSALVREIPFQAANI